MAPPCGQVRLVFGPGVLTYTRGLCQGHYDYLERLPDPLLLRVLAYLELEEVGKLGQTSQRFRKRHSGMALAAVVQISALLAPPPPSPMAGSTAVTACINDRSFLFAPPHQG
ncbi:hypothetical protein CRUP_006681 [Coryphaenoides rupestris]|nr:hypothetical protein CRUP_006681 [Coryphaenoides rupestris]